jgi:hypothetical protein
MSTTLDKIIEEARHLPLDEQRLLREALDREERLARIREVQTKYTHTKTSSDDFAAQKADEIAWRIVTRGGHNNNDLCNGRLRDAGFTA